MEVRCKRQHNKLTSVDTEIANHIVEITPEYIGESLLRSWKQENEKE